MPEYIHTLIPDRVDFVPDPKQVREFLESLESIGAAPLKSTINVATLSGDVRSFTPGWVVLWWKDSVFWSSDSPESVAMPSIELIHTEIDDPAFVELVSHFVSHYADLDLHSLIKVIHIDNWFGERWLGFAGKSQGIVGIRNRSLSTLLPVPPFRPSRVISAYDFVRNSDSTFRGSPGDVSSLHTEKNGGIIWDLYRPGLYCWYSGSTASNTTASLMIYDVRRNMNNAWYVLFDKDEDWEVTKCRNVSKEECIQIIDAHCTVIAT